MFFKDVELLLGKFPERTRFVGFGLLVWSSYLSLRLENDWKGRELLLLVTLDECFGH